MKNQLSMKVSFLLTLLVLITSCGSSNNVVSNRLIQKRKYTKGWNINSNKTFTSSSSKKNKEVKVKYQKNGEVLKAATPPLKTEKSQPLQNNQVAAISLNIEIDKLTKKNELQENENSFINNQLLNSECDRINTNNGFLIEGKVIEVGEKEIKYKKCKDLEGPTYTIYNIKIRSLNHKLC